MSMRAIQIENLMLWINENQGSNLTLEQVTNFVGEERSLDELVKMVLNTKSGTNPVKADDVLAACEGATLPEPLPRCEPLIQDHLADILLGRG